MRRQAIIFALGWEPAFTPLGSIHASFTAWEQKVLAEFDARAAKGDDPAKLEFAEVVTEPAGQYFRYMKALPVQPLCLSCHGGATDVAPAVKAKLGTEYPHDKATGYSAGQIRGAITIKRPL